MRNRRGFTLLELMIAIALMLIVMLMLRTMFVTAQEMYVRAARRVEVYSQARNALDYIEQDMMRMRAGTSEYEILGLRSLRPVSFSDHIGNRTPGYYSELSDWSGAQPNESVKIQDLIAFGGAATWYDPVVKRYISGDATILYYLRRRIPIAGQAPEGAYLVRRVLPTYSLAQLAALAQAGYKPDYELRPTEEELVGFVYSARVYSEDQAAFQLGVMNGRFSMDTMPEAHLDAPNTAWTWVRVPATGQSQPAAPQPTAPQGGLIKFLPEPPREKRVEFGGLWRTNTAPDRDFVSARWQYPGAVVVELCIVDRNFERLNPRQGEGTYRTFSRAIQLPASEPLYRLDDRDKELMNRTK